jgi:hypothetical protein
MIQRDVLPIASTPGARKYDSIELRRAGPFPGAACLPRGISAVKRRIDLPRYKAAPLQSHGAFGNIRQSVICHLSSVIALRFQAAQRERQPPINPPSPILL